MPGRMRAIHAMDCTYAMKYFTVAVMTAINLLNYVDRYTIAGACADFI